MARPTKPKDLKPKAVESGEAPAGDASAPSAGVPKLDLKFLVTIIAIFIASIIGSVGAVYFLAPLVLEPIISKSVAKAQNPAAQNSKEVPAPKAEDKIGMTMELDEFTVNLKTDPAVGGNQFLRTKISLSITVPPEEDCNAAKTALSPVFGKPLIAYQDHLNQGIIAGAAAPISSHHKDHLLAGESGGNPAEACNHAFNAHMAKFVPTLRDIINAALMKRTAGMLAAVEGQENLKDEIKEQINQLIGEKYKVIRVNFSDFIIQY